MKSRSTASQDASPARRNAPRREPLARPLPPAAGNDAKKRSTHRRSAEIIEAAAQVFAERGYHGATTQDIAGRSEYPASQPLLLFSVRGSGAGTGLHARRRGLFRNRQGHRQRSRHGHGKAVRLDPGAYFAASGSPEFRQGVLTQRQFLPAHSRRKVGKGSRAASRRFSRTSSRTGRRSGEFRSDMDTRLATLSILSVVNGCAAWY